MTANDLFQQQKQVWLNEARTAARELLRVKEEITIEDVLEKCPRPTYLHRNITGRVFQEDGFKSTGFTTSRRRVSHGRMVRTWVLTNGQLPRKAKFMPHTETAWSE